MSAVRVCIIGAGNISNRRHIPALLKNKKAEIVGVISDDEAKIKRTLQTHSALKGIHELLIDTKEDIYDQLSACEWFMQKVDAVIIGTPPKQHFPVVRACLMSKKHVLVEKPMMLNTAECEEVMALSKKASVVLYVMHSFQFANGMNALFKRYSSGEFGPLQSILEIQLTNRARRLPVWYDDLPLGLFYDEAAHFFYGARRFGGELKVKNAHAVFNKDGGNTPRFLEAQLMSGEIPVQMFMNFNSPICEWGLLLICEKKIAIYDYFKDILIVLNNDGQHLAKDVLRTSFGFTAKFWSGFIRNGAQMVTGKLLYGHDTCIDKYLDAVQGGEYCFELSAELGKEVVIAMNEVIDCVRDGAQTDPFIAN